jgi:hypothetical protein
VALFADVEQYEILLIKIDELSQRDDTNFTQLASMSKQFLLGFLSPGKLAAPTFHSCIKQIITWSGLARLEIFLSD